MKEEARSRLLSHHVAPPWILCTYVAVRGRLEEWLKNLKYSVFLPFRCRATPRACVVADPPVNSAPGTKRPHVLHRGSNSQVRIRKYPTTATTTTKTVSVLVPISELSCSTCTPWCAISTWRRENCTRTHNGTEGRKYRDRKMAETPPRLLLVSDSVRQQINHKGGLQDNASDKEKLQRTKEIAE